MVKRHLTSNHGHSDDDDDSVCFSYVRRAVTS